MKAWDERHRREALRRTYEIAAEMAYEGRHRFAWWIQPSGDSGQELEYSSEQEWRDLLKGEDRSTGSGLDAARIDREVRRIRALAEGRLVRETLYRYVFDLEEEGPVVAAEGATLAEARREMVLQDLVFEEHRLVRITRIRKAVRL
jgi:hypothetical protein